MVPWCVDALHGRFHWREPGSGLRLSQPATPAPALTLGVRHLSCGVSHPCSGRLTGSAGPRSRPRGAAFDLACGLRCACIPPARSRGRAVGLGACHLSCGDSHCAWGARHLRGGVGHSLCVSARLAGPSQCMRTNDPYRGALPPACWPPPVAEIGSGR